MYVMCVNNLAVLIRNDDVLKFFNSKETLRINNEHI